ncbi:hypothetical protein P7K49_008483 [Saguinus oedipus]|uniref:Uncharacterized protein n=1 Tax=Saguinus oedipus TaxID=9490 RepID=A0ABQ9W1E8_SAGOE|nr:hypothetical protein P7K49_008483 [Saguinus oedipus]
MIPVPPLQTEQNNDTHAFTIQEHFAKRMVALKNKPQVTILGPDIFKTRMQCKRGKKRNKEEIGKNGESYSPTQTKVKWPKEEKSKRDKGQESAAKKRAPAEGQRGDPCAVQSSETSAQVQGIMCSHLMARISP